MKKRFNSFNFKNLVASTLVFSLVLGSGTLTNAYAASFSDVSSSDWYFSYVSEMAEKGFISGVSETLYQPGENLSIAAFSTMLSRAFYGNSIDTSQNSDEWWSPYVTACETRNGLSGTSAENSSNWSNVINDSITRYDMSMMIYNLLMDRQIGQLSTSETSEILTQITDNIDSKYEKAVATAFNYSFLSGREDGSFDGDAYLTRAEAAVVLSKLVNSPLISLEQQTQSSSSNVTSSNSPSSFISPVVTTGQTLSFDADGGVITPSVGSAFYGQDAQYSSSNFSFTRNDNGTTYDNNTGLTWETIPLGGKMTWEEAIAYCENLELGGYSDWRIPTVEELFSISDFSEGWPYLDTTYFVFDESGDSITNMGDASQGGGPQGTSVSPQGGGSQGGDSGSPMGEMSEGGMPPMGEMSEGGMPPMGEMSEGGMPPMGEMSEGGMPPMGEMSEGGMPPMGEMSEGGMPPMGEMSEGDETGPSEGADDGASKDDGQFWTVSHNMVEGDERLGDIAFGVNHSTGHIKAYPANSTPIMGKYVRAVRGDVYGAEDYTNNGDGTITDNASGLMWLQVDLGVTVDWEEALSLAENSTFAGYDDWRLPDVKELQSIVNYDGSYPAINQNYFTCTESPENENYYYWTSTSAYFSKMAPDYNSAWYVAFGYTSHGAGAVRFSPKYEESNAISEGEDNILNSVRLVRNVN